MAKFTTNEDYFCLFEKNIKEADKETEALLLYFDKQKQRMTELINQLNSVSFWRILPEILGIDAKLMLLTELIGFGDFSTQEILRIVEVDYRFYFKELCGYDLSMETKPSIIFNVL